MTKSIVSREEFEEIRRRAARSMAGDSDLHLKALDLKVRAGHEYYWVHQTTWMGEPCLQLAQDMFGLQEAIYRARPDVVIEVGVAWGGTLLFIASLLQLLGGSKVIGIDTFIPADLEDRILTKAPDRRAVELIPASSTDPATVAKVKELVTPESRTLVILDSDHTHDHVLAELRLYAPLVTPGSYLIVGDTIIEQQPPAETRPRPWGKGNNPATALRAFMQECGDFEVDREIEDKLLLSNMPGGYLKKRAASRD